MPQKPPSYTERFKCIEVEGHQVIVHAMNHLMNWELVYHFHMAYATENWDYMQSLSAEMISRGIAIPDIFGVNKDNGAV